MNSVLSVIIVSWNVRELLKKCLCSLEREAELLNGWEVECLVVDNASTDGTPDMLRREFPKVQLIANQKNTGFAAANNQAFRSCTGDYILLLNPDTEFRQGALREMIRRLESDPSTGAVGPSLIGADGAVQPSCFPVPALFREAWCLLGLDRLHPLSLYPVSKWSRSGRPRKVEGVQGACIMIKRTVIEQVGLFDERFFIYAEEADLCRRIRTAGWSIWWLPTAHVIHYGGQSTRQVAPDMFLQLYRSKLEYFRKHDGHWGGIFYKLILFVASCLRIVIPPLVIPFAPSHREHLSVVKERYRLLISALPSL